MVIDDDPDFQSILIDVFNVAQEFELVKTFNTLEEFTNSIPQSNEEAQTYLADLLVVDVMSSGTRDMSRRHLDGATVATMLRNAGLEFAVLLVSSMKSHHFELFGHRKNWEFVQKTSRLSPEEILKRARIAITEKSFAE